ncbi:MAG: NAD-binding protein [Clostridiales bacterium]|nr:NAD-binding protein [Clostridiales bacterium]
MFVLIVGGGKVGAALAQELGDTGHTCRVIEQDPARVEHLAEDHPALDVLRGDGCEPVVLESGRITQADAVAAVTGHDEDNLVVCLLAKREYSVRVTVARINDPRNEWLFTEMFGVDHTVSSTRMMAHILDEHLEGTSA